MFVIQRLLPSDSLSMRHRGAKDVQGGIVCMCGCSYVSGTIRINDTLHFAPDIFSCVWALANRANSVIFRFIYFLCVASSSHSFLSIKLEARFRCHTRVKNLIMNNAAFAAVFVGICRLFRSVFCCCTRTVRMVIILPAYTRRRILQLK